MLTIVPALLAGLLGSAHCVGMCGGFVALLSIGDRRSVVLRQAAYFGGKTMTYAAFGALAGTAGALITDVLGAFAGTLAVGLGVGMVFVGLGLCGVTIGAQSASGTGVAARLGPLVGRLVGSGSTGSLVLLGALNGLLPCGLVYGMLGIAAATGSAASGAMTMAVFGLATLPALALTGVLSQRLRPSGRLRMQRLAGVLVVVMGVLTLARGAEALTPTAQATPTDAVCRLPQ